ncbi:MFS general substrate transporter [Suillus subaureus]|uniref:MFS general substrate transporter n=1 Tax=Suillus subaureus TaxID=48587 RepID=A0A9P7JFH6_9AGAM|nr:MFS general substrate transporter [Suillus subaureus]KAG1819638.1 MFS general substrate transporter [Suillus subaureus]
MVSEECTRHVQTPRVAVEVRCPVTAFCDEIKTGIEHAVVEDDPFRWGNARKTTILIIVSAGSMIAGLAVNIQNPANAHIQSDLRASTSEISWTLSVFILIQGVPGLLWSAISEIKGRKFVYVSSVALFIVASAIVAVSNTIGLVIGMRALQAVGSSALFEGTKMGIYYSAPLLGPALGPVFGGVLTQGLGWRSIFWFMTICAGVVLLALVLLFKDTFRKERSLTYQNVLQMRAKEGELQLQHLDKSSHAFSATDKLAQPALESITSPLQMEDLNVEANSPTIAPASCMKDVNVSLADVNPFPPLLKILTRLNNLTILFASGWIFAFSYSILYTCSRTLSEYYGYDALQIGLVLLSYGIGSICGSLLGGRWSDRTFARLKQENGGQGYAEMRLASTRPAMWFFPPAIIGYAWVCERHVHVVAICIMLCLSGFLSTWIYASTLAYIVDANPGRSSTVVATSSTFRCTFAFVATEVAIPIQVAISDGYLYTLWGVIVMVMEILTLAVLYKGKKWREASEERDRRKSQQP